MKTKLIIDTDPGVDDALALILACLHPRSEIKAISSVFGNNSVDKTTKNTAKILGWLKKNNLLKTQIQIVKGSAKPVKNNYSPYFEIHGKDGLGGVNLSSDINGLLPDKPENLISKIVSENPNEITILSLGPLTNISKFVKKNYDLCRIVKDIVIMGGTYLFPGNYNFSVEANFGWDPDAAKTVLNAPFRRITLIPLNVTEDFQLAENKIKKVKNKDLKDFINNLTKNYIRYYKEEKKFYLDSTLKKIYYKGGAMHDVVGCLYALGNRSFFRLSRGFNFDIETEGKNAGMLKVDYLSDDYIDNKNIYFATEIKQSLMWKSFFSIINQR